MAARKTDNKKKAKKSKKTPVWMEEFRQGQSISLEFFKTNAWVIMVVMVLVLALMGLRYKTKTRMGEIKALTAELQRAESRMLNEKSSYMSLIRESEMRHMVQEHGLTLEFQEQPPYKLDITNAPKQ